MKRILLVLILIAVYGAPLRAASIADTDMEYLMDLAQKTNTAYSWDDLTELRGIFEASEITCYPDYQKALDVSRASAFGVKLVFTIPNALSWLESEAANGDAEIQYLLGNAYLDGDSGIFNVDAGFKWLKAAITQGHTKAMHQMARLKILNRDVAEAEELLTKAAEGGLAAAQYDLGVFYNNISLANPYAMEFAGLRRKADVPMAMYWWEKAAAKGNAEAMAELIIVYASGNEIMDPNYDKAFEWAQKAAAADNVFGQSLLGTFYQNGIGVQPSRVLAYQWFLISLDGDYNFIENYVRDYMKTLEKDMTKAEINKAKQNAKAWQEQYRAGR